MKKLQQKRWFYIKDSGDFIKKIHKLDSNANLVIADVLGLYLSMSNGVGLRALSESLDKGDLKPILMEKSLKMDEFALKTTYFE